MSQTSREDKFTSTDFKAEMLQLDGYHRISYSEQNGAQVVLDINGSDVSMKRHDSGLTHGLFSLDHKSSLSVHSDHGVLVFDVKTLELKYDGNTLYINYQLLHNGEVIDVHVFELSWKLEG